MRIAYLDQVRAFAILTVVWIHTWDSLMTSSSLVGSFIGWNIFQAIHLPGRMGVPLFVMLTGALLLGRSYSNIGRFILEKIPRFIAVIIVTAFLYQVLHYVLYKHPIMVVFPQILSGYIPGAYQLWYIYMLIGLYVAIPFLAKMLSLLQPREISMLIGLGLLFVIVPYTLRLAHVLQPNIDTDWFVRLSDNFIIRTYVLYALTGYYLQKHGGLKDISLKLRCFCFAFLFFLTICLKCYLDYAPEKGLLIGSIWDEGILWYDSVFIYLLAVILFSIIRDWKYAQSENSVFVSLMAKAAFAIYLWHLIIVHLAVYFQYLYDLNRALTIFITFPLAIGFGFIVYKLLAKTKLSWLVR